MNLISKSATSGFSTDLGSDRGIFGLDYAGEGVWVNLL